MTSLQFTISVAHFYINQVIPRAFALVRVVYVDPEHTKSYTDFYDGRLSFPYVVYIGVYAETRKIPSQ